MSAQLKCSPRRRKRLLRTLAALAVLVGLAVYLVVQYVTGGPGAPRCTVRAESGGEEYELSPEQAANAATISAVGAARGLPGRAVTIALATAMQESGLRNIDYGDRDSVGLFQQRPSQDWGTVEQIMDPVYSAGEFYTHLVKIPDYSGLPLTVAAQKVQRSGYPDAYAKHETNAALLTSALTGRAPAAMTCSESRPADKDTAGVDPVRRKLAREFGPAVLSGARTADGAGSGSNNVLTLPVRPDAEGRTERRGWQLATWALAHSAELRVEKITYAGRTWSADDSGAGWRGTGEDGSADGGGSTTDVRIVTAARSSE